MIPNRQLIELDENAESNLSFDTSEESYDASQYLNFRAEKCKDHQ